VETGFFTELQCPAGMAEATAFDESMAQMRAAEALGFDAVWLGDARVLSSMRLFAERVAPRLA
jgi:alkanesulfonate monooxygenase SsuD/methylene tetrahydromethanopterin reductase-like flavin-dependent oxidoreductase (luciferase family)